MNLRNFSAAAVAAISLAAAAPAQAQPQTLLPEVKQLTAINSPAFVFNRTLAVNDPTASQLLLEVLAKAGATVDSDGAAAVNVTLVDAIPGAFNHNLADYPDEAYTLTVNPNEISISAVTPTGVIRAAQTLAQLIEETPGQVESLQITDWPAFKLRGYMHDVGRSFISIDELKKEIELLGAFKVNTFHWHMTENQAWRFEVKKYPQLTSDASMTRLPGKFYTQDDCRELLAIARKHGITVIPEIDMPGHSEAFQRAMGFDMQTDQGKAVLLDVLEEVADVFADCPYIHIGADERTITDNTFLPTMIDKIHALGKKAVCWNPIKGVNIQPLGFDMTQMWSTSGRVIAGRPNIDCRYNYINHFDVFSDLVGIYKSSIYYTPQGTDDVAGTITAIWNDRNTPTQDDIICQNNFYASVLASAERAWKGGGKQYIETGGIVLPNTGSEFTEFADWERRFLFHKDHSLANEPIPYVRQTDIRWNVTEMFDNQGNSAASFAPEQGLDSPTWTVTPVRGAGAHLRHYWGTNVPGIFGNASINRTVYAYTYVYSPCQQTVGALIEFQNYSRSEKDLAPDAGKWDRKGSRIWLNDEEILPPVWDNSGKSINNEVLLGNENFAARPPMAITLKEGWNKVLVKLPYVAASGVRLNKWMWTFVITEPDGRHALDGIIYSPSQNMLPESEDLSSMIAEARSKVNDVIGNNVGWYAASEWSENLLALADDYEASLSENLDAATRRAQISTLQKAIDDFMNNYAQAGIVLPRPYNYYHLSTPLRSSRYATDNGGVLTGDASPTASSEWCFERRPDSSFDIVNYSTKRYISPTAANNTQITTSDQQPAAGWQVLPANEVGYVILVSGSTQLNQTNSGLGFKVYNWGSGTNITDTGCKYTVTPSGHSATGIISTEANAPRAEAAYDLQGRPVGPNAKGIVVSAGRKILIR